MSTTDTLIREARTEDTATLVRFNQMMAQQTEGRALDAAVLTRGVEAVLRDETRGFYLIAERSGEVVGQLMVTYEHSDWRDGTFFWIQSVFVAESARRRGVYRSLHDAVIERAQERGDVCGVRLYVERDNAVAMRTYESLGMERTVYEMFELEMPRG